MKSHSRTHDPKRVAKARFPRFARQGVWPVRRNFGDYIPSFLTKLNSLAPLVHGLIAQRC